MVGALAARGDALALTELGRDGHQDWSCDELAGGASRLAAGLEAAGPTSGARVLLFAPNSPAWVIACLALLDSGAIPVPVDSQAAGEDLRYILTSSGAAWVFTVEQLVPRLEEALEGEASPRLILLDGDEAAERHFRHLFRTPRDGPAEVEPEREAVLFFTSGSSGRPKGVPLTHVNLRANLYAILAEDIVHPDDRLLLPLHHVYPSPWDCSRLWP